MTILYEYTEPSMILLLWVGLILVGFFAAIYKFVEDDTWKSAAWAFIAVLAIGILGCVYWTPLNSRYSVTFDHVPSIQDIQKEYVVIKQAGLIWTLERRDTNEPS